MTKQYVHYIQPFRAGTKTLLTQYSTVYTVLQNGAETDGEIKTPLSHSLAGSEPHSEEHWLA